MYKNEKIVMYRKILVPHAGTKAGNKALEIAKKLAKVHKSHVTILHIVEKIPNPTFVSYDRREVQKQLKAARRELKMEAEAKMREFADKLQKEKISANVKIMDGYPEEEIAEVAKEGNYDLIVMAKRRKLPGLKAILKLGSVSRKVLEQVSCPILLIDGEK